MNSFSSLNFRKQARWTAALAFAAALASYASVAGITVESQTLNADTDWRGNGVVTVPEGTTIDLNGHNLWLSGLAGSGTFASAAEESATFDLTTSDASKVSSTNKFYKDLTPASNLFNDNYDRGEPTAGNVNDRRIIIENSQLPLAVDYDFGSATHVNSYKVYAGGYRGDTGNQASGHQRTAKSWNFYGSDDKSAWALLDSRTVTDWNDKTAADCKQFTFFNAHSYRYYRMEITAPQDSSNGYTELVQLEYGSVGGQVRIEPADSAAFAGAETALSGNAKYVIGEGALAATADLTGLGAVTLEGTIDLNGYALRVGAANGVAVVTNSASRFDLTTAQTDDTYVKSYYQDETTPTAMTVQPAWKAFADYAAYNNTDQRVCDTAKKYPVHIVYDFGEGGEVCVDSYKLTASGTASTAPARAPKTLTFYGSQDGSTWTELDPQRTETGWSASETRTFTFDNTTAWRYYRLSIGANNGDANALEFFMLEYGRNETAAGKLWIDVAQTSDLDGIRLDGADLAYIVGDMTLSSDLNLATETASVEGTVDLNGNSLYVASLSGGGTVTDSTSFDLTDATASRVSSGATYLTSAANAFADNATFSSSTRVIASMTANTLPICIDYDFGEATLVNAYRITGNSEVDNKNAYSAPQRQPKSFKFLGSNDGSEWVELDERTQETAWTIGEERQYEFDNTTAYRHYRIAFYENNGLDNGGTSYLSFFKLEYGNLDLCGHLHVVVPSGDSVENDSVALAGNLRLVKEGAGTFTASKTGQTYAAGTEVLAGTAKFGAAGTSTPFGGAGRDITVGDSATIDMNGCINCYGYEISLDGGTLANTGAAAANSSAQIKRMRLTADSSFTPGASYGLIGNSSSATTLYLGGHTLGVMLKSGVYFYLFNTTITAGNVNIASTDGSGAIWIGGTSGVTATNVDFSVAVGIKADSQFSVCGYESKATGATVSGTMKVYGVFKPTVAGYYPCTLQNGATLDLTEWPSTAGWPVSGSLSFAAGTAQTPTVIAVAIDGSRSDIKQLAASGGCLVEWETEPENVEFVRDGSFSTRYGLRANASGLKLIGRGFIISIY